MRFFRFLPLLVVMLLLVIVLPASAAGTITLISYNSSGTATANGSSIPSPIAVDSSGNWVLFGSTATNLVSGFSDTNGSYDVFLYNTSTGVTTLVSRNTGGTATGNGTSTPNYISADGSKVLFTSQATNLTANTNLNGTGDDVYLYDVASGITTLISRNFAGTGTGNAQSGGIALSANGGKVVFISFATNLTSHTDTNGQTDVYLYDVSSGITTLVSHNLAGTGTANGGSQPGVVSNDGSKVVFSSSATNLTSITDTNSMYDVFLFDAASGTNTLISHNLAGTATGNGESIVYPAYLISDDNSKVIYMSNATNLTSDLNNNGSGGTGDDAYLYDVVSGTNILVSRNIAGTGTGNQRSTPQAISMDGSAVIFNSDASNLSSLPDTNSVADGFLFDVATNTVHLISHNQANTSTGNGNSAAYTISTDGNLVLLDSTATNVVSGFTDTNADYDAFIYDVSAGTATLISQNTGGTGTGNNRSIGHWLSNDGTQMLIWSKATNLTTISDTNATDDVFFYEAAAQIPPTITSANTATFYESLANTFTVTATGTPTTMTYSLTGALPAGVSFNPATGVLSGTPAIGTVGSYPVTITASNGVLPDASQSFTLLVAKTAYVGEPLGNKSCTKMGSIVNMKLRGMIVGRSYTYTMEVRDGSFVYMSRQFTMTFAGPAGTQTNFKWIMFPVNDVPALNAPQTYWSGWTSLPASVTLRVSAVDRTTNLMTQTNMTYTCADGVVMMSTPTFTPNVTGAPYAP